MNIKVLIAAGGSGGHLFPAQQLTEMLQRKGECELLFAGYKLAQTPFFAREKIPFVEVAASPLARIGFPIAFIRGFLKSLKMIRDFGPDVIVGFGSYHVFPILCAAVFLGKKLVLFEANSVLGKVNRFFAPFARCIAVQFPMQNGTLVPLLPWVSHQEKWDQKEARRAYRLDPEIFTFLVFGGSQGAQFLNVAVPQALARMPGKKQVIHFTGSDEAAVRSVYERLGISACVKQFEPKIAMAYAAADCAICRSGAGTVAELIRHQLPALLIPFPEAAEDHQRKNGEYLADYHAARLLLQKNAHPERLISEIEALIIEIEAKKLRLQKIDLQNVNRSDFADLVRNIGVSE